MEDPNDLHNYERFTAALERRPKDLSPLMWLASLGDERPPEASEWMLRWLEQKRELRARVERMIVEDKEILDRLAEDD